MQPLLHYRFFDYLGTQWLIGGRDNTITCLYPIFSQKEDVLILKKTGYIWQENPLFQKDIVTYLDQGVRGELSLQYNGTPFQLRIWDELLKIPYGETISYQELASRIHSPKACRAVANAIGKNPIAILVPCHRVIKSDGQLGGYKWGTCLKKTLLSKEVENHTKVNP